ncbi:MAG: hypothetical protein GEU93_08745 [Propionibacteriales bacterium]|nr:hypothetical protein [Propionibacteriales bacterium]
MKREGHTRRLWIHIGAPKTGTTYLQDLIWRNKPRLAAAGVYCPGAKQAHHHRAALDLRQADDHGARRPNAPGSWDRLSEEVAAGSGDCVITSELLAWTPRRRTGRAFASFPGHQVHVVFTMRDFVRQIPAVWQEWVKNRGVTTYEEFVEGALRGAENDRIHRRMWRAQDPRRVLRAWGTAIPPEQVHVITVPPAGAPPDALWQRFCRVLGVDPAAFDTSIERANEGLNFQETEFLRRINLAIPDRVSWATYNQMIKTGIARHVLGRGGARIALPPQYLPAVRTRTEEATAFLREQGYDVVGDLADLDPPAGAASASQDEPEEQLTQLLDESAAAVARLVDEVQRSWDDAGALRAGLEELRP